MSELVLPKWVCGQGHLSNVYIVDLENFATASRRYTGDIHNSTVVGLFMTPETIGADSVASWLSAHCYIFDFNRNYVSILYRFRDIAGYWSKVADFDLPHLHSAPS